MANQSANAVSKPLDWALATFLGILQALTLWPFHTRGVSYFDEGTQLRLAALALNKATQVPGVLPLKHGYPGFDLFYGLYFRLVDFSLLNLRREVLVVMTLNVFVFVLLARRFLRRGIVIGVTCGFMAWQWGFYAFAYYSREANLCALTALLFLALWLEAPQKKYLYGAGLFLGLSITFKFNVGCAAFAAAFIFLMSERREALIYLTVSAVFLVGMVLTWSVLAQRPTDLVGTMLTMPVSYARHLSVSPPKKFFIIGLFFFPLCWWLWKHRRERAEMCYRLFLLLTIFLVLSLTQDYPRHWLAHLFWIPLPFWIFLGFFLENIKAPRVVKNFLQVFVVMSIVMAGAWFFKPWNFLHEEKVDSNLEKLRGIQVSTAEKVSLEKLSNVVQRYTKPGEGIFVFPVQPLFYFLFERPNVTSFDNLHGGWRWEKTVVEQLEVHPPALIISLPEKGVWDLVGKEQAPLVVKWLGAHYYLADSLPGAGTGEIQIWRPGGLLGNGVTSF